MNARPHDVTFQSAVDSIALSIQLALEQLCEETSVRLGVDLGGTKTEILALGDQGQELIRERVATPASDYESIIRTVTDLVTSVETSLARTGSVGMGIPGAISPATGLVKNANTVVLNGRPLRRDLEAALGRPIRLANDANCFALSEASDGAAAGSAVAFGVILGTGTGGGIISHGRVLVGANAIGGEWGHNPLPWPTPDELPGPRCYCGKNGCIETFLSGPGLARDHQALTGHALSAAEIALRADAGDPDATATLERYERRLAKSLASVINILDPDVVVLGGGLSNLERLYKNVQQLWQSSVFSDVVATRLVKARHGDSSGVRGAAWLWP